MLRLTSGFSTSYTHEAEYPNIKMDMTKIILLLGIVSIVLYDVTNGFHDAADMIATAIASRTIRPAVAITLVTVFTFIGPILGGVAVADTIGEFVNIAGQTPRVAQSVVIAAILSAITYNLLTWRFGLPSSSSNSLTSGLVGAGLLAVGSSHIHWGLQELAMGKVEGFMKVVAGMVFSPLAGFIAGFMVIRLSLRLFRRFTVKANRGLIIMEYVTVSWLAFSHGTNDAQKGMGVMAMLLYASGVYPTFHVSWWIILLCASSITIGTLFGGWNIIKTVGFGIYKVRLIHSIADQLGSAFVILASSVMGAPTSTTQVVTTTLMGVGAGERPGHVHWATAKSILTGWSMNIPVCLSLGALYYFIFTSLVLW